MATREIRSLNLRRLARLERHLAKGDYTRALDDLEYWCLDICELAEAYDEAGDIGSAQYALAIGAFFDPKASYLLAIRYASGRVIGGAPDFDTSYHYFKKGLSGEDDVKARCYYWMAQLNFQSLVSGADFNRGKRHYKQAKKIDADGNIESSVIKLINNI